MITKRQLFWSLLSFVLVFFVIYIYTKRLFVFQYNESNFLFVFMFSFLMSLFAHRFVVYVLNSISLGKFKNSKNFVSMFYIISVFLDCIIPSVDYYFWLHRANVIKDVFYKKLYTHFVINHFNLFLEKAKIELGKKLECNFSPDAITAVYLGRIPLYKKGEVPVGFLVKEYRKSYKNTLKSFLSDSLKVLKRNLEDLENNLEKDRGNFKDLIFYDIIDKSMKSVNALRGPKGLLGGIYVESFTIEGNKKSTFRAIYLPPYYRHYKYDRGFMFKDLYQSGIFDNFQYEFGFPKVVIHELLHFCFREHSEDFYLFEDKITNISKEEFLNFIKKNRWKVYKLYFSYLFSVIRNKGNLWR